METYDLEFMKKIRNLWNIFVFDYLSNANTISSVTLFCNVLLIFFSIVPDKAIICKLNYQYHFYSGEPRNIRRAKGELDIPLASLNKSDIGNLTYK